MDSSVRQKPDRCVEALSSYPRGWLIVEMGLLVILVLAFYAVRIGDPSIRGEEPRRAQIGVEMIRSGDWVVPRQQGHPFLSRPPLQNWMIAVTGLARGTLDVAAIRIPSVLATLFTVLLIYGYARRFLSGGGAFASAVAYATMGQVMELGRLGETEALFTFMVTGSLLIWHWGRMQHWPAVRTWGWAYLFVALGTLVKGPQAPVYFATSVGAYLLLTRRWRDVISWAHLAGLLVFLAVWGAWQIPFFIKLGWEGTRGIYVGDVALRFVDTRWVTFLKHLVTYPIETFVSMLPWSVLLMAFFNREFRRRIVAARDPLLFLLCCIVTTYPSCWLVPGARGRYFMPLYPCFAILIGLVIDRSWEAAADVRLRKLWSGYLTVMAGVMIVAGAGILAVSGLDRGSSGIGEPWGFALFYLLASAVLAWIVFRSRGAATDVQRRLGLLGVAVFVGLTLSGVLINIKVRRSEPTAEAVARLKRELPQGTRLVSFGPVESQFAYYYADPIEQLPLPGTGQEVDSNVTYFCFSGRTVLSGDLPFSWKQIATISCERRHKPNPRMVVVVGQRLPGPKPVVDSGESPLQPVIQN